MIESKRGRRRSKGVVEGGGSGGNLRSESRNAVMTKTRCPVLVSLVIASRLSEISDLRVPAALPPGNINTSSYTCPLYIIRASAALVKTSSSSSSNLLTISCHELHSCPPRQSDAERVSLENSSAIVRSSSARARCRSRRNASRDVASR